MKICVKIYLQFLHCVHKFEKKMHCLLRGDSEEAISSRLLARGTSISAFEHLVHTPTEGFKKEGSETTVKRKPHIHNVKVLEDRFVHIWWKEMNETNLQVAELCEIFLVKISFADIFSY